MDVCNIHGIFFSEIIDSDKANVSFTFLLLFEWFLPAPKLLSQKVYWSGTISENTRWLAEVSTSKKVWYLFAALEKIIVKIFIVFCQVQLNRYNSNFKGFLKIFRITKSLNYTSFY